jgi:hypothetical protein
MRLENGPNLCGIAQVEMLRKKVRVYRSHVARLRQELTSLSSQRHLPADLSSADFPLPPPLGWAEQGNSDRLLNDEGKSEFPKNSRRERSAASEQYWADRKASSTSLKYLKTSFLA